MSVLFVLRLVTLLRIDGVSESCFKLAIGFCNLNKSRCVEWDYLKGHNVI